MRYARALILCFVCLVAGTLALTAQTRSAKTLDIYYIDVEGGQATLFLSPSGESLLVDTGFPGDRDLNRILSTLKDAGVKQIDHLWTTHYHTDHVGTMEALARQIPIMRFYDHGKNAEAQEMVRGFNAMYEELSKGKRTSVKPGDKLPMAGLDITVVAAAGQAIKTNLAGGGRPNAACADVKPKDESAYRDTDNGYSAGFVMNYGQFRTIDLGDLTWNVELDLMCPVNRVGPVDLYLTSHHGINQSNSPALVHGLQPRVAIMNNGTRKGGSIETFQALELSPGLEDLWQLHWSYNVGLEHNAPGAFIANIEDNQTIAGVLAPAAQGPAAGGPRQGLGAGRGAAGNAAHTPAYLIKVSAGQDGVFTVTNTRNGFSKTYRPRNN